MASIHRQPGRPFFFCSFTTPDGKRRFKSTKATEKKQALEICRAWAKAAKLGRDGKLTPDVAREVIGRGVADVFAAANREDMPVTSIRAWCKAWLESKQIEAEPSTTMRYKYVLERFTAFLGAKADRDVAAVTIADVGRFRDAQAKIYSRSTANLGVKVLRACFNAAYKQALVTSNPASAVDTLRQRGESKRRPFTMAELRRVLDACVDSEWRGLVLFGIYTGQRLGDLSRLTWRALDMDANTVAFTTQKTGRRVVLPLVKHLREYLLALPSTDDPDAYLFPKAAKANPSHRSDGFYRVLVAAGLAEPRTHAPTGKGRCVSRPVAELSFHSLRHTATTFLKAAGVSDSVAMEIIGHESAAVSRGYTHLSTEDLRRAMEKLPDVTTEEK
ncbi:MAG: site-specific integrase [Verrucomicrobia bacterium]|nr:site-specific integrase [Verrucomicrobiota bacterium]